MILEVHVTIVVTSLRDAEAALKRAAEAVAGQAIDQPNHVRLSLPDGRDAGALSFTPASHSAAHAALGQWLTTVPPQERTP